jgi:CDGSH-type Zn-finger protein
MASAEKKIEITPNGPYLVSGNIPLDKQTTVSDGTGDLVEWKKVKEIKTQSEYALCRCGHSKSKPFCDGSHFRADFNGTETADNLLYLKKANKIRGTKVNLTDVESLCSGTGFCHRANSDTWALVRKSNDPKAKKLAIESACNCPSGRLVVWDKKVKDESGNGNENKNNKNKAKKNKNFEKAFLEKEEAIEPNFKSSISITEEPAKNVSGPIWVKGKIKIVSADGKTYETRNRVTLCRCGKSRNKPFCDGTHAEIGFTD